MHNGPLEIGLKELADDRTHGASQLARRALEIAAAVAHDCHAPDSEALLAELRRVSALLAATRPAMAPLHNLLTLWGKSLEKLSGSDLETTREEAAAAARRLRLESERAVRRTAIHAATLVRNGQTVITHSLSSVLLETFSHLRGRGVRVIATESRPLCEGYELASHLSRWGIAATLITDAQIALAVEEADIALVGADSLLEDGSVVNKAGTSLLALAARQREIPFCVACESFKRRTPGMPHLELETMPPEELGAPGWPGVDVANTYFEITPAHLVTKWTDENGIAETWHG